MQTLLLLTRCLIAAELVSHRRFDWHVVNTDDAAVAPVHAAAVAAAAEKAAAEPEPAGVVHSKASVTVLDGATLTNLEVLRNENDHKVVGSLFGHLNKTATPFGQLLLRRWLMAPLVSRAALTSTPTLPMHTAPRAPRRRLLLRLSCRSDGCRARSSARAAFTPAHDVRVAASRPPQTSVAAIELRLDAVEELMSLEDVVNFARSEMRKLPDLERLLSRVHTLGSKHLATNHPMSRAIM